jgi:phage baseplate assembly protein W
MARSNIYTPTFEQQERYSDFLLSFDKNPQTGNLGRVTNEQSIKQALKTLILTDLGERFYSPFLGSKLKASLFDPVDPATADLIRTTIFQCVTNNEPRVNLLEVVVADDSNNNRYIVSLIFNLINIPDTLQLDLLLKRAR